jgi:hypothetical protein
MRASFLLPLAFTALAACGSEVSSLPQREEAAARIPAAPERDLTLPPASLPPVEVASPVELPRVRLEAGVARAARPRPAPKPAPTRAPEPVAPPPVLPVAAPTPPIQVPTASHDPAPEAEPAAGAGRELAPGRTITVIPVSSGPSLEAEEDAWLPSERGRGVMIGGGGGTCRRGGARGIVVAGRIPVGIPDLRLR